MKLKPVVFIAASIAVSLLAHAERKAPFSLSVGTQTIGVRYQFTDEPALVETAKEIMAMKSDILKFALTPKYQDDYRMERDERIECLVDLLTYKESYLEVMDMPFRNFIIWVYPFSDQLSAFYEGKIPKEEAEGMYQEIYDLTRFLLKRYSGTGKSFFMGNWEGDWHMLRGVYDYDLDPETETIEAAKKWFLLREKAVADARRDTPHKDVNVFFYIELNHVRKSLDKGKPTIVNRVLPHIRADFVSWSSYDITTEAAKLGGEAGRQRVFDALNYIEKHLPPSDVEGQRVFIGEYGANLLQVEDPEAQRVTATRIMQWSLEWGCPFTLYWELYCNEIDSESGEHRGHWLIDDHGVKQPAWDLHVDFLEKANHFVEAFEKEHGRLPSQQEYKAIAATWLNDAIVSK
jgi:hypothetical protein